MQYTLKIYPENWSPEVDPKAMVEAAARAVTVTVRRQLRRNEASGGKRTGWPRSHFWQKASEAITTEITGRTSAMVAVGNESVRGVALQVFGGVVRPTKGRALAIPADPEVAEIWPSEYRRMDTAHPTFVKKDKESGRAFIARKDGGAPNGLKVLWWLVPHATIPGNRSLWPDDNVIRAEAEKAVRLVVEATMGAKK